MKVIITGATGKAGREVVKECLQNDRITSVIVLTRSPLPGDVESHPKVDMVMHQDFSQYSDYLIRRFQGASACIWAIGGRLDQIKSDKASYRQVGIELPVAAARIFSEKLAGHTPSGAKFRFVCCSAKHCDKSKKKLMFANETRRYASEMEKGITSIANAPSSKFESFILRPATFAASDSNGKSSDAALNKHGGGTKQAAPATVDPARVAKAMVMVACDGGKERVIENDAILRLSS